MVYVDTVFFSSFIVWLPDIPGSETNWRPIIPSKFLGLGQHAEKEEVGFGRHMHATQSLTLNSRVGQSGTARAV